MSLIAWEILLLVILLIQHFIKDNIQISAIMQQTSCTIQAVPSINCFVTIESEWNVLLYNAFVTSIIEEWHLIVRNSCCSNVYVGQAFYDAKCGLYDRWHMFMWGAWVKCVSISILMGTCLWVVWDMYVYINTDDWVSWCMFIVWW